MDTKAQPLYAVLNPDDIAYLEKRQSSTSNYSTNNFISIYDIKNLGENFSLPSEIREGDVLVLTGENVYSKIQDDNSVQSILQKRVAAIDHICYLLGCTNYLAEETLDIQYKDDLTGGIKGQKKINVPIDDDSVIPVEGGGSIYGEIHQNNKLSGKTSLKSVAKGNVLTEESYKKAISIAREYNLLNVYWINFLIEQRNPKNPGAILQKEFHIELSLNIASSVKTAIELNSSIGDIISSKLNLDTSIEQYKSFSSEFSFTASFPNVKTDENIAEYTVLQNNTRENLSIMNDIERESGNELLELKNNYNQLENALQELKDGFKNNSQGIETIQGNLSTFQEHVHKLNSDLKILTIDTENKIRTIFGSQFDILKDKYHDLEINLIGVTKDTNSNSEKIKSVVNELPNIEKECLGEINSFKEQLFGISNEMQIVKDDIKQSNSKTSDKIHSIENDLSNIEKECQREINSIKEQLSGVSNEMQIVKDDIEQSNSETSDKIEHLLGQQTQIYQELSETEKKQNDITQRIENVSAILYDNIGTLSDKILKMTTNIEQIQQQYQTNVEIQKKNITHLKVGFIMAFLFVVMLIISCAVYYALDNFLL